jgi:lysyl-tRNA synthetase class 2
VATREKGPRFPSDLVPGDLEDARHPQFLVAGRVIEIDEQAILLADAFATVRLTGKAEVDVGDLVVLSVRRDERDLAIDALVERHRPRAPLGAEHSRLVREGVGTRLAQRSRVFEIVRSFFAERRFIEVDTPLLVSSPGLDLHLEATQASGGYLITSPEYQMKRLLVGGVPKLFQISHVFRRGEVGARHNPEFTMLEWYRAFADVESVMRDTEELVAEVILSLAGARELKREHGLVSVVPPFARMTVAAAFARFAAVPETQVLSLAQDAPDDFFRTLVDRVEPALAREDRPVFLVDYPISQASLARAKPSDPGVCERFELYLGGIELCNGFGELTDPVEQRRRLLDDQRRRRALDKPVYPIDERFLAALEEGMPPSAGNALGLDRLVALSVGEHDIARVMPFPSGLV